MKVTGVQSLILCKVKDGYILWAIDMRFQNIQG